MVKWLRKHFSFLQPIWVLMVLGIISTIFKWLPGIFLVGFLLILIVVNVPIDTKYPWEEKIEE